jgi:hypothetical protein
VLSASERAKKITHNQLQIVVAQFKAAWEALSQPESDFFGKEELLDPYIDLLDNLQLSAEYYMAEDMTNVEAFKKTCELRGVKLLDIIEKQQIQKIQAKDINILNIHANILGLTIKDCKLKVVELLDRVAPSGVNRSTLRAFADCLARQYRLNSYHNFTHCVSVCQIFYYMWSVSPGIQRVINVDDMYIGCLASLCHDLGHRTLLSPSRQEQRVPRKGRALLLTSEPGQEHLGARPYFLGSSDHPSQGQRARVLRQTGNPK